MTSINTKKAAYTSLYIGMLLFFVLALILNYVLPQNILNIPKFFLLSLIIGIGWFSYLTKVIPRCQKCGYSVFSIFEIYGIPIILKSFVSDNCANCGSAINKSQ